jgi:hypothetical protein
MTEQAWRDEDIRAVRTAISGTVTVTDDEIVDLLNLFAKRGMKKPVGFAISLGQTGKIGQDLKEVRDKRAKTGASTAIAWLEKQKECEHGKAGGECKHPAADRLWCRLCEEERRKTGTGIDISACSPDLSGEDPGDSGDAGTVADEPMVLAPIPAYPVDCLAGPLHDLVTSTALPPGLMAGAGLGALAGLTGQATLLMPDDSVVRPVLWVAMIGPRGAGKTPALDIALDSLRELDAAAHAEYRRGELASDPTRRIDDATLESVARWLNAGDGTGLVESDELSGWLQNIGQYKRNSGDKGRWLALWSAQPWRYQRVGDKRGTNGVDLYIAHPVVSVLGGIQPHLHYLLGDEDSGFRPRWLPHLAPLGIIEWRKRHHFPADWDKTIRDLYERREARQWTLDGEALQIWQAQSRKWKRRAHGAESTSVSAALDKSDIQCARIALVLAESMFPGQGGKLPLEAVESAVGIVDYVLDCWRALPEHSVFALSRRSEKLARTVDQLTSWLETRESRKASRRDILRANVAGVRTAGQLDMLLAEYMAVYPGHVREERLGSRGPAGIVVHAPRRRLPPAPDGATLFKTETVGADSFSERDAVAPPDETAGQSLAASRCETVGTADSFSADSFLPTVSGTGR